MTFILNNHHGIVCYNVSQLPPVHLFRVDHMRFQDSTAAGSAIQNFGCRGVIDTSEFDNLQYPLRIGWGDPGGGGFDWNNYRELVWGKPDDNMYVEDCVFTNISTAITNSDEGGRYALRYNSFGGTGVEHYPWLDIHGGRGSLRGGMGGEVYGNIFSDSGYLISHRGGRLAFFYNSSTDGSTYHPYNNDGCSLEAKEQINNSYIFRNRSVLTGTLVVDANGGSTCAGDVVKNQDYFIDNVANDGTNGVGAGLLSSRPVTCTTGVGYWATNQSTTSLADMVGPNPATPISGTLYKCTATNTWTAYYTPLVYPHPLRSHSQTTRLNPPKMPTIPPQFLRAE
jgi:hypothetical protein